MWKDSKTRSGKKENTANISSVLQEEDKNLESKSDIETKSTVGSSSTENNNKDSNMLNSKTNQKKDTQTVPTGSPTVAKTIKGLWSAEEDRMLLSLIEVYGASRWVEISHQLKTRTAKQCRERYHQNLRPNLNKTPISREEGEAIKSLVTKHGFRWTLIAKLLNTNRSDNSIKNWWKTNVKKRQRNVFRDSNPSRGMMKEAEMMAGPDVNQNHRSHHNRNQQNPHPNDLYSSSDSLSPRSDSSYISDSTITHRNHPQHLDHYENNRHILHSHSSSTQLLPMGSSFITPVPKTYQQQYQGHNYQTNGISLQPYVSSYAPYSTGSRVPINMYPTLMSVANTHIIRADTKRNSVSVNSNENIDPQNADSQRQKQQHSQDNPAYNEITPMNSYMGSILQHNTMQPPPSHGIIAGTGSLPIRQEEAVPSQHLIVQPLNIPTQQNPLAIHQRNTSGAQNQLGTVALLSPYRNTSSDNNATYIPQASQLPPLSTKSPEGTPLTRPKVYDNNENPNSTPQGNNIETSIKNSSSNKLPSFEELTQKMKLNNQKYMVSGDKSNQ